MRKSVVLKNPIVVVGIVISVCCLLVTIISVLRLPEVSLRSRVVGPKWTIKNRKVCRDQGIGKFGEMMVEMLPEDLGFTVFIPSKDAFERDLGMRVNDSFVADKWNDTYAVVSRILGFSAVPRSILSSTVPPGEEASFDSLSGFILYISKDVDGMLVVNRIRAKSVDIRKGNIVVHIMDGVIMDAEFEQSVRPDYIGEDTV